MEVIESQEFGKPMLPSSRRVLEPPEVCPESRSKFIMSTDDRTIKVTATMWKVFSDNLSRNMRDFRVG